MFEPNLFINILLLNANHFWLYENVLKLRDDTEEKPGLKPNSNHLSLEIEQYFCI